MSRAVALVLGLLLAAASGTARAAPGHAAPLAEAKRHFERGTALYQQGRYDEAVGELEAGYALDPRPDFLYALGQAQRKRGDCKAAVRYYQAYVDTGPSAQRTVAVLVQIDRCKQELAAAASTRPPPAEPRPGAPSGAAPAGAATTGAATTGPATTGPATTGPATTGAATPAAAPSSLSLSATAAPAAHPKRLYQRWWLWTLVGVAVAGAGVGLGVALTQRSFNPTLPDLVIGKSAVRF